MMFVVAWFCTMGAWAFEANGIYYGITSTSNKTVEVMAGETQYSGDVTIPATVAYDGITYRVTSIGNSAFYRCSSLASITLPESLSSIGDYAFGGCSSLQSIEVAEGNVNYASIDGVLFDKNVTTLITCPEGRQGDYKLPNGVTSIGDYAFSGCSSLTSITIPKGVTSIGENAFYYCSSLTSIEIPEGVTSIEEYAFNNCSSLASIVIPEGVTEIESRTFYNCSSLTSITLPESLTSIGEYVFSGCSSLASIVIPERVTTIGEYVFSGCSSLQSIEVDERNTNFKSIDGVLFNKDVTEILCCPARKSGTYTIPAGVMGTSIN